MLLDAFHDAVFLLMNTTRFDAISPFAATLCHAAFDYAADAARHAFTLRF